MPILVDAPLTLPAGPLKRCHVNQHLIRANAKDGGDRPVLTVKCRGRTYTCHAWEAQGPSRCVTTGRLSCGARVWVESTAAVVLRSREPAEGITDG